jgi:EAL domain-containing protein (putative c-di-GMP-specific phosphodiesterase class I)
VEAGVGEAIATVADMTSGGPAAPVSGIRGLFTGVRGRFALLAVAAVAAAIIAVTMLPKDGTAVLEAQHAAVRSGLSDLRPLIGSAAGLDDDTVQQIGAAAGLDILDFESSFVADGHEAEPVLNADGRIIGFLTWPAEQETLRSTSWLPLLAGAAAGFAAFAAFWLMRRQASKPAMPDKDSSMARTQSVIERSAVAPVSEQLDDFVRRELPLALAADALAVHYQPIMSSDGARIVGVEALLRWTHQDRGAIPPATFIPVAERHGLMDEVGAFVLRRALAETRGWPELFVAVNLSPVQMRDPNIIATVRDALGKAGVPASRLMLEITEGVLIDDPDTMVERIGELRALGVRIALDDFGSGYSNLGYLLRFPIDKIKIDRSFVTPLGRASNGGVIVQAIVGLGRALGATVLAEGVETEEQRVLLRLAGCEELQGFLFARPAPADAIERLLSQHRPRGQTGAVRALTA